MHTNKRALKVLAPLLAVALLGAALALALTLAPNPAQNALTKALGYLEGKPLTFGDSSTQSDWKAFALAQGGKPIPQAYLLSAASAVEADSLTGSTDYARAVLVLTAMGYDARDFAQRNLLAPLLDKAAVTEHLPAGPAFALLGMNSHSAYADDIPGGYDLALVELLLEEFTPLGWSAGSVNGVDIDTTAMVLQALAPYYGSPRVKAAADAALALLAAEQFPSGGFGPDWGEWGHGEDSCSTAQVVTALSALGLDAAAYFAENPLDYLLGLQAADGSFDSAGGENPFADAQVACALAAYTRCRAGGGSLFSLSAVTLSVYPGQNAPAASDVIRQ